MSTPVPHRPPTSGRRLPRWARRTLLGAGLTVAGGIGAGALALAWYLPQLPPLDTVVNYVPREPLQVYTADGQEIAQFGSERRRFTPIERIPQRMQDAVLAVEDRRFHEHAGVDLRGIARALLANLAGRREGASTITQQVARNFFLSSRISVDRKIREALLALRIERELDKPRILELYMNQIFLGQRSYGFAAAAETYFGKTLEQLDAGEIAMLAGLPQNPSFANPVSNMARARKRQAEVLKRMVAAGVIDEAEAEAAAARPLRLRSPLQVDVHAEHVAEMARQAVVERFGTAAYAQGLRVYTTLQAAEQQAAWQALRRGVLAYDARQAWRGPEDTESLPPEGDPDTERAAALALRDRRDDDQLRLAIVLKASPRELQLQLASGDALTLRGEALRVATPGLAARAPDALAVRRGAVLRVMADDKGVWRVVQWPEVQGALVALDAASGRVRALVGGFDFVRQPFNHVTQAQRQPGSSFKPFIYAAAMEYGFSPDSVVNDAPIETADGWSPGNSDGQYDGPLTLRQALARSKNTVSVRLLQTIGVADALAWSGRYGIETRRQPDNLTLALGAGSVSPMQLAQAYAVLANGGWRVSPLLIARITDARGQVLYEAPAPAAPTEESRAVPERNIVLTNSLLNDVTRVGTAARAQARLGRSDLYGKTGTTNDAVDAWFAGFQTTGRQGVVAVSWIGFDQPRSLGERESGGGLALPVWMDYMATALRKVPASPPLRPPAEPPLLLPGLTLVGGDWRYDDWTQRERHSGIGLDPEAAASEAEDAASAESPDAPAASAPPGLLPGTPALPPADLRR
ncbi:MAG: Penicillin-binding protein [Pseudomonadota bacterium]|jgi:penicillin-binding protein 1A